MNPLTKARPIHSESRLAPNQIARKAMKVWLAALPLLLTLETVQAQSGPTCETAAPIAGEGAGWVFAASGNTVLPSQGCGPATLTTDSYFQWTAEESGTYEFMVTTGQAYCFYEIYQGPGCPGTFVACGEFSHSDWAQTSVVPNVQAGDQFLIRGVFEYAWLQVTLSGNGCDGVGQDPFDGNDQCGTAGTIGNGTYPDLSVNDHETDYYSACVASGEVLSIGLDPLILNASFVMRVMDATNGPCGPLLASTQGTSLSYQNTSGLPQDIQIAVESVWWFEGCNRYGLTISGANGCGGWPTQTTFCDPMDVNTTGLPTVLTAIPGTGIHSGIRLEASQGPPNQFGSFILGSGAVSPGIPLGQGRLCLATQGGNQLGRYNVAGTAMNSIGRFDGGGTFQNLVGTSVTGSGFDVPTHIPTLNQFIRVGETWHFQMWHREPNGGSNWSNGVSVTFPAIP